MRFAFVTDVHLGPKAWHEGKLRKLSHLAEPLVREFIQSMNEVERPDVIVNLGDVIEDESPAADLEGYEQFVTLLGDARAEIIHVAGNHELVNLSDADLARVWQRDPPLFYTQDFDWLHVIVLRTNHRRSDVRLAPEQIAWLRSDLEAANKPTLVFVHHPLGEMQLEGNKWFERQPHHARVIERRDARAVIEASGNVLAVFNGHVHWNHLDVIAGIPYVSLQSLTENLDDDEPGRPARAWAIADVNERGVLVRIEGEHRARYQFERPCR